MARRPRAYLPGTPSKEKTRAGRLARASLSPPSRRKEELQIKKLDSPQTDLQKRPANDLERSPSGASLFRLCRAPDGRSVGRSLLSVLKTPQKPDQSSSKSLKNRAKMGKTGREAPVKKSPRPRQSGAGVRGGAGASCEPSALGSSRTRARRLPVVGARAGGRRLGGDVGGAVSGVGSGESGVVQSA